MTQPLIVDISPPESRPPSLVQQFMRSSVAMAIASPLIVMALWEILVRVHLLDARFFPPPSSVVIALVALAVSGELFVHIGWTLTRVVIGLILGAVPGILLGLAMGLSSNLRAFLKPTIAAFYPIPKIALFPLIMLLFGIGETSKWVIVAIAVFFQVLFSTLAGVVNIDRIFLEVSENFGATRLQAYRTVALPGALPFIFSGLHLGLGMALIVVVIAENFGTKAGLGFMVWRSWQVFEIRDMYVALVTIALLGYCSQLAMTAIERIFLPWKAGDYAR
jgi:ABC-type nitrate/sulfonate/bicarbonate transport system permease component